MKAQTDLKILLAGAALMIAGCGNKSGSIIPTPGDGGGTAHLTSVTIGLPDRASLKTQVADIETKMNAYHLIIGPVDASCPGATKLSTIDAYSASPTVSASLAQGCDYDVILALGKKADAAAVQPPPPAVAAVTYDGQLKTVIDSNCVSCHKAGGQFPDLSTFDGAKKLGARIQSRVAAGTMPTRGALAETDKALVKAWVDGGLLEKDAPAASAAAGTVDATKLGQVYYKNATALRIRKEDIAGKASFSAPLKLQLQDDGKAIGLTIGGAATGGSGTSALPAQPVAPVQPAIPAEPAPSIPSDKDFDLVDSAGKTEKLSSIFKGKYMLLDFSSSSCGYCIQRAGEMDGDTALQKQLDGSKCSHATFVPQDDLQNWFAAIGGSSTFSAKHSYQLNSARMGKIVEAFGVTFSGTPTFILIDATGKSVADENGVPADAINQHCK